MRVAIGIYVVNPKMVDVVYPYLSRRVDNIVLLPDDAHMHNLALLVVEKCQIARQGLFHEGDVLPDQCLLTCIPWNLQANHLVQYLR